MEAYRVETVVQPDGTVTLQDLPLPPGQGVEVIVLPHVIVPSPQAVYPLRGTEITYLEPTEPVASEDWESAS